MNTKDLRVLLEGLIGKFRKFKGIDSLKDQQRLKLLNTDREMPLNAKSSIIKGIINNEIKLRLFEDFEFMSAFDKLAILNIILSFDDFYKMKILQEEDILERYDISNKYKKLIIESLEDKNKQKILFNREYLEEKLGMESCEISGIVASIEDVEIKEYFIEYYKFNEYYIENILKTFPDQSKINILINNKYKLSEETIQYVLVSLNVDSLISFFNNNKDFLIQKRIAPYQITSKLQKEEQLNLISKFESISLSVNDKKKILSTLDNNIKKDIDTSEFSEEYIKAIKLELNERVLGSLIPFSLKVDLNGDLESYIGLDELLYINGMNISKEDKPKLFKLAEICPSIPIYDDLGLGSSTIEEYKNAEDWIEAVLEGINPNWTDIQKLAYIDNAIGKKISYSPDFNTEVFDHDKARPLWKIIDSGYGVCNGIVQVEKYILNKIGIETEIVRSRRHEFLKVKNIEIIAANGKIIKGDTILDPTWNLSAHKFGG